MPEVNILDQGQNKGGIHFYSMNGAPYPKAWAGGAAPFTFDIAAGGSALNLGRLTNA